MTALAFEIAKPRATLQAFHDRRKFPQGVRSPQTTPQVAQVRWADTCAPG